MACTDNKFVINKGLSNEFQLTIKQQGSTLPMTIDVTDTFVANLYLLSDNSLVGSIDMTDGVNGQIVATDLAGGIITITMKAALVDTLTVDRGSKVDEYYLRPSYRLALDCVTVSNGNFVAKLPEVYVE